MRKIITPYGTASLVCILTLSLALFSLTDLQAQCSGSDTEAPNITCPADMVVESSAEACGAVVTFADATATDNCPPTSMPGYIYKGTFEGHTYFVSTFAQNGATAINTAAATGGHLATISSAAENNFIATIAGGLAWIGLTDQDSESNFVWVTGEPFVYTNWAPGEPNNVGNEDWVEINRGGFGRWNDLPASSTRVLIVEFDEAPVQVAQTGGLASGSFFSVGETPITFTATDAAGNQSSCTTTISVIDNTPPEITCPADITANVDAGTCCAAVSVPSPTGTDNCSTITFSNDYNGTDDASDMYFPGESIVIWTATDEAGLTATCEQRVTVVDDEAPVLGYTDEACIVEYEICLADQLALIAELEEALEEFIASCNGDPACLKEAERQALSIDEEARKRLFQCLQILNNCEFIPAENNLLPDLVVEVEAGSCEIYLTPGPIVMENCAEFTLTNDYNSTGSGEGMYPVGTVVVTWTAVDQYGNTSTVSRSIMVLDLIAPDAICQDITVQLDAGGNATVSAEEIDNGSNDNCSDVDLAIISGQTTFNCDDVDNSYPLVLEATDAYGNKASCSATVTVSDNELPDADCDGFADVCDVCPDGDDSVDANGDGIPDCSQLLPYAEYSEDWKCQNNKIDICHDGNTLCISQNALSAHFNHGDAVGPCQSCGGKNLTPPTGKPNVSSGVLDGGLQLTIFPNPASTEVTLDLHGMEDAEGMLSIFDQTGRELLRQDLAAGTHILTINLPEGLFPPGTYVLRVVSAHNMLTKSMIIQR